MGQNPLIAYLLDGLMGGLVSDFWPEGGGWPWALAGLAVRFEGDTGRNPAALAEPAPWPPWAPPPVPPGPLGPQMAHGDSPFPQHLARPKGTNNCTHCSLSSGQDFGKEYRRRQFDELRTKFAQQPEAPR